MAMLDVTRAVDLDQLIAETIPAEIRLDKPLDLPDAQTEVDFLAHMREMAANNQVFRSYIGQGYYSCVTPNVIVRNVLENPGWYTPYTPYQAEIAQGRLEGLLNFQTMVSDLTGLPISNASLLDEATAAAEAMTMLYRLQNRRGKVEARNIFFVSRTCFPQTLAVLQTRAKPLGIQVREVDINRLDVHDGVFGLLLQNPDSDGAVRNHAELISRMHRAGVLVGVATDLLSLTWLKPPGEMGADVVFGNSQRFGVPMGYGGPHAAFFATRKEFVREVPGRVIGMSVDAKGRPAYRMALQTREQHIRRERAKSNICTAQALLANVAGFYAVYHGSEGLRELGRKVHAGARWLADVVTKLGFVQKNELFFDTILVEVGDQQEAVRQAALLRGINFRYEPHGLVGVSLGEPVRALDLQDVATTFAVAAGASASPGPSEAELAVEPDFPDGLTRRSEFLTHSVFRLYQSETDMMRYLKRLERKDLGLDTSMIPLGSCTMKLNAAVEMMPVTWPEFGHLHPFVPTSQAEGYRQILEELERALCEITGFAAVSLQPNSGAQGEYAGLMVIRAYHEDHGEHGRDVVLIPASAHGTNPATAVMCGMSVVVVRCDEQGNVDVEDMRDKAERNRDRLAGLMITYPSTHGVFEESIQEICQIVHERGGLVYMDGANLNAQVGLTNPARIGADLCHMNLHKTFAIPHGGGGPGMGPIGVIEKLTPYLPAHPMGEGGEKRSSAVSAAPWGSASILLISYAYIKLLGVQGLVAATRYAILNANYVKARLEGHYDVLFSGPCGRVAHELIFDLRPFKQVSGVTEEDVAKRLMDYGFHAPTVSWPVPGTMMIEPTESESKAELDRFCDALISIRAEIESVITGEADRYDNVLKNAPHTAQDVATDIWEHSYSREQAAFPLPDVRERKVWPAVARINNPHGDRNLVCSCAPVSSYVATGDD